MKARVIRKNIYRLGVEDWNRRLFDSLIPLPDGTSYNAYLIKGSEKTALIDTVDPAMSEVLVKQLKAFPKIDYIISQHAEQDHSGSLPLILEMYPQAEMICSSKAKPLLMDHLGLEEKRIRTVEDGEEISLGDRTLRFVYTPWVHWPETMVTYLPQEKILFSCDFLGSHIASTKMYAGQDPYVLEAAKRYYAEIMMPFRSQIRENLKKINQLDIELVAPSHGPIYDHPEMIISAYEDWVSENRKNQVVIPYISMHGSTAKMVDHLASELVERGVEVQLFDLSVTDIGKLAMALVDAATIVIGTPTVHVGPHPIVHYAAHLANAIRPKVKYAAVIGSYGWATKAVETITALIPNLKVEVLGAVMTKGDPDEKCLAELTALAEKIKEKHAEMNA